MKESNVVPNYQKSNVPTIYPGAVNNELQKLYERIAKLEEVTSNLEQKCTENDPKNQSEFDNENYDDTKAYIEKIESDSYLFLSIVLSYNSIWLTLKYTLRILCASDISLKTKIFSLMSIFFVPLLYVPGLATPLIQVLCFYFVYMESAASLTTVDLNDLIYLKLFLLVTFGFMVAQEASQAINSMFFCYFEATQKKYYFIYFCFLPQLFQLFTTFALLYVSILLMMATDDAVDLLQNFAALYVILELDNIMMNFLRLTKFNILLMKIDRKFKEVRDEFQEKQIYTYKIIRKILIEEEFEVDYEAKPDLYKNLFIYSRVLIILGLIGFGVLMWIVEVYESLSETQS